MCGIVAASARRGVSDILISGLHALEYRGYDSAGLAVHSDDGIKIVRAVGKLRNLEKALSEKGLPGRVGIDGGHGQRL